MRSTTDAGVRDHESISTEDDEAIARLAQQLAEFAERKCGCQRREQAAAEAIRALQRRITQLQAVIDKLKGAHAG